MLLLVKTNVKNKFLSPCTFWNCIYYITKYFYVQTFKLQHSTKSSKINFVEPHLNYTITNLLIHPTSQIYLKLFFFFSKQSEECTNYVKNNLRQVSRLSHLLDCTYMHIQWTQIGGALKIFVKFSNSMHQFAATFKLSHFPKEFKNKVVLLGNKQGGRTRLLKFKFSAKFPIGLHVILQIQIRKFENDCYIMWKIILTENPSRFNVEPLLK